MRGELDAYYARLYGLTRDELRYILDPQDVHGPNFPGETFRVLKEKEIKKYGEYRTRRLVLEAWDRLFEKEMAAVPKEVAPDFSQEEINALRQYVILLTASEIENALRVYTAKILFFAQVCHAVKLNYHWTLLHHGPYDRAFEGTLNSMQNGGYIEMEPYQDMQGIPIRIKKAGYTHLRSLEENPKLTRFKESIQKIITDFKGKSGRDMELRATLAYLHKEHPEWKYDELVTAFKREKEGKGFTDREIEGTVIELEEKGYIDKNVG